MRSQRVLAVALVLLASLIATYAVLGPLVLNAIHFRTSTSGLNQIRGGDLAALVIVAPTCVAVAALAWRGHAAAPVLALAPATFAMYTYSQLILGNEYLRIPGNVERFFPLLLGMFVLAAAITLRAWGMVGVSDLPAISGRLRRGTGVLLIVIAAFVTLGLHLPTFVDAMRDQPTGAAYLDTPTVFWVVKFYDLGIVVPAAVAVGVGLLRRRPWARKPSYAILGGYVLLGWSVAGMAWIMVLSRDADASWGLAGGMTAMSMAATTYAYFLYRPLFHRPIAGAEAPGPRPSAMSLAGRR